MPFSKSFKPNKNNKADPKGYYAILGVAPNADFKQIKLAFRDKVKYYHPDHNKLSNAAEKFQALSAAYDVLSNELKRSIYDIEELADEIDGNEASISCDYYLCENCACISKQPRFVRFFEIKGRIFGHEEKNIEGLYCFECASKKALISSLKNWIFGWWGLPFAPYFNIKALLKNFKGGEFLEQKNKQFLLKQSLAFLASDDKETAVKIAYDALNFEKNKEKINKIKNYIAAIKTEETKPFSNDWNKTNKYYSFQLIPFLISIILLLIIVFSHIYSLQNNHEIIINAKENALIDTMTNNKQSLGQEELDTVFVLDFNIDDKSLLFHTLQKADIMHSTIKGADIYKTLQKGETIRIVGVIPTKKWVKVMLHDGTTGFIDKSYIKKGKGNLPAPPDSAIVNN
jgi:curved DNA-binding protein CbpA